MIVHLTPEQQAIRVAELLEEVKAADAWNDSKHDEFGLRRVLRAREWNVKTAKSVWLETEQWRRDWNIDSMLQQKILSPEEEKRFRHLFPHGLHGVDKMGRPVLIYQIGKADCAAALTEFSDLTRQKVHAQMMEFLRRVAMPACSLVAGRHMDQITTIYDLEGVMIKDSQKYAALLTPPTKISGMYYVETHAQLLIVNAPYVFDSLFAVSKRMLAPHTQKKIQVFGSRNTASGLASFIAPNQLPLQYGGTSSVPITENWGPWTNMELSAGVMDEKKLDPVDGDVGADAQRSLIQQPSMVSVASFHTCLSEAESAFLQSFLVQPPSRRYFVPGLGATDRQQREVSAITEEQSQMSRVMGSGMMEWPDSPKKLKHPGCCSWLCGTRK